MKRYELSPGQLAYLRERPLYPWAIWLQRTFGILIVIMAGASMVGAGGVNFTTSLFCLLFSVAVLNTAVTNVVISQVQRVVLSPDDSGHEFRISCGLAILRETFNPRW
jgi:hypothetical protein